MKKQERQERKNRSFDKAIRKRSRSKNFEFFCRSQVRNQETINAIFGVFAKEEEDIDEIDDLDFSFF